MASDLKLRIMLNAIDRVTAPLRQIQRQTSEASKALKGARENLKRWEKLKSRSMAFAN